MAMSMNNLKIFINTADAGSLTKAAEALYISQPAVSKAIKSIEDDLGAALFYRDKKSGISLTDTGKCVLGYARQMMLMEEKIYQTAYLSKNLLEGTLKIASLPSGITFFLADAIASFQKQHPQVNIELMEGSSDEVNKLVADHSAEFGISIVPADGFQYELLMEDHIVAISNVPLEIPCIDLSTTRQSFFVCKSALDSILPVLDQKRIKNRAIFKILGAESVRKMVECGNGIGLQGKSLLKGGTNRFYEYPVEPLIKTDLILIANSFENLSPAAKAFIDTVNN